MEHGVLGYISIFFLSKCMFSAPQVQNVQFHPLFKWNLAQLHNYFLTLVFLLSLKDTEFPDMKLTGTSLGFDFFASIGNRPVASGHLFGRETGLWRGGARA